MQRYEYIFIPPNFSLTFSRFFCIFLAFSSGEDEERDVHLIIYIELTRRILVERWRNREMERWRDGEMERWRDGEMERWRDGEMERWRGGEMKR